MNNRDSVYLTADEYKIFMSLPKDYDPNLRASEVIEEINKDVAALLRKMEEEKRTGNSQRIPSTRQRSTSEGRQLKHRAIRSNSKASESNDRLRIGDANTAKASKSMPRQMIKKNISNPHINNSQTQNLAVPKSKITPKKEPGKRSDAPTSTLSSVARTPPRTLKAHTPRRGAKLSDASTEPGYMKDTVSSSLRRRHANEN